MRSPGTMIPTRFSGSAAAMTTRSALRTLWQLAVGAQGFDGYGKRELLSQKSIDESAAAHFAAVFEAAVADLQFAPAGQIRFAHQQVAEDHAIATQQHPAAGFDAAVAIGAFGVQQRPASRAHAAGDAAFPSPLPDALFGVTSARRFSNPSAVTRPAATSSHSPVSISALSRPVARTMSGKNSAPRCFKSSSTSCATGLKNEVAESSAPG